MGEDRSPVTNILLICREGESRRLYQAELDSPEVSLVCVQALMEFFDREVYCPLNGILIDMPTYMRSSEDEKHLLTVLVGLFPALRLKCNEATGEIRTLPFGTSYLRNEVPSVFVSKYCRPFIERKIRTCERSHQTYPAILHLFRPAENVPGTKSVTTSISREGCFLVSFEPWNIGERGWLAIADLEDASPIPVEVRSVRPWGEPRSLPGMGVRFIELTGSQKDELSRLGGRSFIAEDE
ncbi:MAG: PilZ domain-containing protein [Deltaproteobacteria bacterium]|nr:PilZ domain-containing protein [Deltaproteobacteria bacterium]